MSARIKFSLETAGTEEHLRGLSVSLFSAITESILRNSPKPLNFFLRERLSKGDRKALVKSLELFIANNAKYLTQEESLKDPSGPYSTLAEQFMARHRRVSSKIQVASRRQVDSTLGSPDSTLETRTPELESSTRAGKLLALSKLVEKGEN